MKVLLPLLSLSALAVAQFNYDDWHSPGPDDFRGPCPLLNSLANHGFLPRDGRNSEYFSNSYIDIVYTAPSLAILTVRPVVDQAALINATAAVNLSTELAVSLFLFAMRTSSDPASNTFSLQDLSKHNILEHDGSLSRPDVVTPGENNQKFNQSVYDEFKSFFGGATEITLPLASTARWGRIKSAQKTNPNFLYGTFQRLESYIETAVYFQTLQNSTTGTVPVNFLDILFCTSFGHARSHAMRFKFSKCAQFCGYILTDDAAEERLPAREGWRPLTPMNGLSITNVILQLAMAVDEKAADLVLPPSTRGFSHLGEILL